MFTKLIILFSILFFSIELCAQVQSVTLYNDFRKELVKNGSNDVLCTRCPLAQNSSSLVGREPGPIIYRDVWQWNIPDNVIPDGSIINSVHLSIKCTNQLGTGNLYALISNISYDISGDNNYNEIFAQMTVSNMAQVTSSNGYLDYQSNDPQDEFIQALQNALSDDRFVIGIRWNNDVLTTSKTWYLSNYYVYNQLYIEYTVPVTTVTIDQRNSQNQQVGSLKKWDNDLDQWGNNFNPGSQFSFNVGSQQVILADQTLISGEKYNNWNGVSDVINHHSFFINEQTNSLISYFRPVYTGITIKNALEGTSVTGGFIEFLDPWYIDFEDQNHADQNRNRGMENAYARERESLPFTPDYTTSYANGSDPSHAYQGVFLNQSGPPYWNPPYYTAQALTDQDIPMGGKYGTRTFYFHKWGGTDVDLNYPDYQYTGVVFKTSNAEVDAVLKGHLLSGAELGTNGQRHLVRDSEGYYHLFYVSLDKVWYTQSLTTSISGAWDDELSLFGVDAKSVSIDIAGDLINLVIEGKSGTNYKIYRASLDVSTWELEQPEELADISSTYYGNAYPVIAATNNERFFVYRKSSSGGLYYIRQYYDGIWHTSTESSIPNTGFTSLYPAVCMDRQGNNFDMLHLVYQEGNLSTSIKYRSFSSNIFSSPVSISDFSGYSINTNPSISPVKKDKGNNLFRYDPIVSWLGRSSGTLGKTEGTSIPTPRLIVRVCTDWVHNTWGSTYAYGEEVNATQNASVGDVFNQSVITWGQKDGTESRWIKRIADNDTYYGPYCLNPAGYYTNISNGSTLSDLKAFSFDNESAPYIINPSTTAFTSVPDCGGETKAVTTYPFTYARAGVLIKKGIKFAFHTGDVVVSDSAIKFISVPDTNLYQSAEQLNQVLRTIDFPLSSHSTLIFSNYYYVLNKDLADTLNNGETVTFRVELVNSSSGNIVGTFDNVLYDKTNLDDYENISYQVDCSGITEGDYFFRLVTSANGDAEYNLLNSINDASTVAKRTSTTVSYSGSTIPLTYELSQNYPNPFNPVTTIKYQLPKNGSVTLKIYDILGKEVATLVNEQKNQGRYSVNFDASRLASGVYIYRLQVNDYVNSKKMLLLK